VAEVKPVTLTLASGNRGKLAELEVMLAPLGFELHPQSDWNVPEAVEDGATFLENALIKARNATLHTGLPAIADDSGLVVPALGGDPGIHSARYAGAHGRDEDNNRKLLEALSGMTGTARAAYFFCAMVMLRTVDDPVPLVVTARWRGEIANAPAGNGGFGYDPIFWLPERRCTSAELPSSEKNLISHRGQAARSLVEMLEAQYAG
jgi:XTP/dITP diphosphohydrolase